MSDACVYCGADSEYVVRELCTGACGSYVPPDLSDEELADLLMEEAHRQEGEGE